MRNKNLFLLLFLFAFAFTQAQVITSKKEAVKKGVYGKSSASSDNAIAETKTTKKAGYTKAAKAKKNQINDKEDKDLVISPEENYLAMQMINNAMQFIGVNYRPGGISLSGMDCSGMVTAVFNIFDMKLPRSSNQMAKVGAKIKKEEVKKGDLVFFKTNGRDTINHVGLVVESDGDEIKFIHSSTSKGVIISSTKEPYYSKSFAQANRVL